MRDKPEQRKRMLIRVCEMYYMEGLSQQEIADKTRISRPQISRMLNAAKAEGIVNVTIKNPYAEEQQYEDALESTFGLREAVVVKAGNGVDDSGHGLLGAAGAELLEGCLQGGEVLSVMAGQTVKLICNSVMYFPRKELKIVPAIGGWGNEGRDWHANANAKMLGESLKCNYYVLNCPGIVATPDVRNFFYDEPEIASVMSLARSSSHCLMGIGQMNGEPTIIKSGVFSRKDFDDLRRRGAVASLCSWFIDRDGNPIDFPAKERVIGLDDKNLRAIPHVIAAACGPDKVEAILAGIRGKWFSTLITDIPTAKGMLKAGGVTL